jgi:hypothetical protein
MQKTEQSILHPAAYGILNDFVLVIKVKCGGFIKDTSAKHKIY